jgi:N-formylglutamate amidohydrolase
MTMTVRPAALLVVLGALTAGAPAQVPQAPPPREVGPAAGGLVTAQRGQLPVILSAPHGGTKGVPGVVPRRGEGLAVGGSGFFAGRDGNTEELADAIAAAIEKRTGKPPYLVAARFHRKYIDANRPPDIAYEEPRAKPVYDDYRDTLAGYCRDVRKTYGRGLLLDVHGQGAMKDAVIRGTKDGKTVALLVQRYGVKAHTGPDSFFGLLAAGGCKVYPANLADKEYASLNGGNIVQTYGGGDYGIDAIQLEFGGDYRAPARLAATAAAVAAAVEKFTTLYLTDVE